MEQWKDISGYVGLYQVSNLGRIKALPKKRVYSDGRVYSYKETVMRMAPNPRGYVHLNLFTSTGRSKSFDVHRLVATHFVPNPENKKEVNHINGIKSDNRAENLEWSTSKENKAHGFKTGLYKKENQGRGKQKRNAQLLQQAGDQ